MYICKNIRLFQKPCWHLKNVYIICYNLWKCFFLILQNHSRFLPISLILCGTLKSHKTFMWCWNDLEDVILIANQGSKFEKFMHFISLHILIIVNPFLTIRIVTMQLVFCKNHIFSVKPLVSNDSIFVSHYIRIIWLDPFSVFYKKITTNAL